MVQYLVSKLADPMLGIASGIFAYYIWETDTKASSSARPPPGRRLHELVQRWYAGERPPFALYSGPNPLGDRIDRLDKSAGNGSRHVV